MEFIAISVLFKSTQYAKLLTQKVKEVFLQPALLQLK